MYKDKLREFNFKGIKTALVIRNDDPLMEQRVAVFIPELMPNEGGHEPNTTSFDTISNAMWHPDSYIKYSGTVSVSNFKWAKCSQIINAGTGEGIVSGDHNIPRKGTWVPVYFEDEDPQKLRYLPFGSPTKGQALQLINLIESDVTKNDPVKRANIYAKEFPNGNIMAFDFNPEVNTFVIRFTNGYHIKITDTEADKLFSVFTPKGHLIEMDDINDTMTIESHNIMNQNCITLNVYASKVINVNSPDINITADNSINMKASNLNIEAEISIKGNTTQQGNTSQTGNVAINGGISATGAANFSGSISHKGTDIGKDHKHLAVRSGPDESGSVKP